MKVLEKETTERGRGDKGFPMEKTIRVKWMKSAIVAPSYQMKTIRGLGFKRLYQTLDFAPICPGFEGW